MLLMLYASAFTSCFLVVSYGALSFSIGDSGSFVFPFFLAIEWGIGGWGFGWGNQKNENTGFFLSCCHRELARVFSYNGFIGILIDHGITTYFTANELLHDGYFYLLGNCSK